MGKNGALRATPLRSRRASEGLSAFIATSVRSPAVGWAKADKKNHGFVVLIGVIVVGAIGLAVSVVLSAVGSSASVDARIFEDSARARVLAESCVEEALQQITDRTSFSGSGTQTVGGLSCDYTVINLGGHNREINAWAVTDISTARFEVVLDQVRPEISIVSWQEVESF